MEGGRNTSILVGMPWLTGKWEDMSFPDILQKHVHDYYRNKHIQQRYGYNIFLVVQDQIRYDGETNPPTLVMWQPG